MRERVCTYKDDELHVEITVHQVSLRESFHRLKLRSREEAQMKARDAEVAANPLTLWAAFRALPDCLGATVSLRNLKGAKKRLPEKIGKLRELSFEAFLELPEALIEQWQRVVYECNPNWLPRIAEQGEASEPEDETNLTNGSSDGSTEKNPKTNQTGT